MRSFIFGGAALTFLVASGPVLAQEKTGTPRIVSVVPLEMVPGVATTLRLRGMRLNDTSAVEFLNAPGAPATIEIREKKKADAPAGFDVKEVGDSQVELLVTLPADWKPGAVAMRVTAGGETSAPLEVGVIQAAALVEEKEPNGGFRDAQSLKIGQVARGLIKEEKDVDVFRFSGKGGGRLIAKIVAAQRGSWLDSLLSLFDARGNLLASNDDSAGGANRDSFLEFTLPAEGDYFLSVQDAHDRGGAWHAYELSLEEKP